MEITSVFVAGANRGIGLEFVKQLVNLPKPPKYVFATFRSKDKSQALEDIANSSTSESKVILIKMDITDLEAVKAAAKLVEDTVGEEGLTLLINNAGRGERVYFPNLKPENLNLLFNTNTVGPVMVFQELLPSLQKASQSRPGPGMSVSRAAVLNISSMGGSILDVVTRPTWWLILAAYRTSKAALNMAMRVAACTVKDDGILVLLMCPGMVKTELTGGIGEITAQESVSAMLDTVSRMDESHHGLFFDRKGNAISF